MHDPINAAHPDRYKRFIRSGSEEHTALGFSGFYTFEADGVPLYQWGDDFVNEEPEWVGTIAVDNPWEFMHKVRVGQPGFDRDGTHPVVAIQAGRSGFFRDFNQVGQGYQLTGQRRLDIQIGQIIRTGAVLFFTH